MALTRARYCFFIFGNSDVLSLNKRKVKSSLLLPIDAAAPTEESNNPNSYNNFLSRFQQQGGSPAAGAAASSSLSPFRGGEEETGENDDEAGPSPLVQAAKTEFLSDINVWTMLMSYYRKLNCIVSGPFQNLRVIKQAENRSSRGSRGKGRMVMMIQQQQQQQQMQMQMQQMDRGRETGRSIPDYPLTTEATRITTTAQVKCLGFDGVYGFLGFKGFLGVFKVF